MLKTSQPETNYQSAFAEIAAIVAKQNVTYQGQDREGNLTFRLPVGTPLLSQDRAAQWGRRLLDALSKSTSPDVIRIVESASGFKIVSP